MKKKIALFGCGGFARNHIRELGKRDEVSVAYVVDPSPLNRSYIIDSYRNHGRDAPWEFDSLESFIAAAPDFDAGVVVTPPDSHYKIASEVLKAGKPVYVEKPFTITTEEAKNLVRLSNGRNLEVVIGANRCVFPAYRAAANALKNKEIGDMQEIGIFYKHTWEKNTTGNWRQDPKHPGLGILSDHSPHYFHFLFTDLDFLPDKVRHLGSRFNESGIDVDVCYSMADADGRINVIAMNGSPPDDKREEQIKIHGSAGDIIIRFEDGGSNAYINHKNGTHKIDIKQAVQEITSLGIEDYKSHPALIHNFVSLLSGYTEKNANPGETGILPVHAIELLQKSRGFGRQDTLDKQELGKVSDMVKQEGCLNIQALKRYPFYGTVETVDKSIFQSL